MIPKSGNRFSEKIMLKQKATRNAAEQKLDRATRCTSRAARLDPLGAVPRQFDNRNQRPPAVPHCRASFVVITIKIISAGADFTQSPAKTPRFEAGAVTPFACKLRRLLRSRLVRCGNTEAGPLDTAITLSRC